MEAVLVIAPYLKSLQLAPRKKRANYAWIDCDVSTCVHQTQNTHSLLLQPFLRARLTQVGPSHVHVGPAHQSPALTAAVAHHAWCYCWGDEYVTYGCFLATFRVLEGALIIVVIITTQT